MRSRTSTRLVPGAALAALALAACLAPGAAARAPGDGGPAPREGRQAAPRDEGRVRITIIKVRATTDPAAEPGRAPEIDPALKKFPIEKLPYRYTKYQLEETIERTVPWRERLSVPLGNGGSYEVEASPSTKDDHVVLAATERAPGSDKACLAMSGQQVPAGKVQVWFCDRALPDGTYLFFVSAVPVE